MGSFGGKFQGDVLRETPRPWHEACMWSMRGGYREARGVVFHGVYCVDRDAWRRQCDGFRLSWVPALPRPFFFFPLGQN